MIRNNRHRILKIFLCLLIQGSLLFSGLYAGEPPDSGPVAQCGPFELISIDNCSRKERKLLAEKILADKDLKIVLQKARNLMKTGLAAGGHYQEVWIRDLNTFMELAIAAGCAKQVRKALTIFFHFQGKDGHIIDGYIPAEKAVHDYAYIASESKPQLLGHKNTVETDQETSLIQAVCQYVNLTGDSAFLHLRIKGRSVWQRMRMAVDFLLNHRYSDEYNLLWGATTVDWGDVQPEHEWGVALDKNSHKAIDIYDNAMLIIALRDMIELQETTTAETEELADLAASLESAIREHLWDAELQKFRPHIYISDGSPFPEGFAEERIYYHGGTAMAMKAGILHNDEIKRSFRHMLNNKYFANAASVGLTIYPPYPRGLFENPQMQPFEYQNGGDWTWIGGRIIQALIHEGYLHTAYREILPMVRRIKKNNGFYEWYSIDNQPKGASDFRGAAGVLGVAIENLLEWAKSVEADKGT